MISRFVEPVSRSDGIFDSLAIPAKQVSGRGMIKIQSKLNVNVSGIGRFFKRLQYKQCGLKKLCIFGFLGKSINKLSKNGEHYKWTCWSCRIV